MYSCFYYFEGMDFLVFGLRFYSRTDWNNLDSVMQNNVKGYSLTRQASTTLSKLAWYSLKNESRCLAYRKLY